MSWQRILEAARNNGLPVIVTDVAGREPLAVLPLAEYERLLEVKAKKTINEAMPLPVAEETPIVEVPPDVFLAQATEQDAEKAPKMEEISQDDKSGLTMEERFYLEPTDEGTA